MPKRSRKSEFVVAFRHMRARWTALTRCLEDGRLGLDHNPAERTLRGVAIGRKNYLFAGSDAGGRRAAAMYSSRRQSSTASTHRSISPTSSRGPPATRPNTSPNCCPGIGKPLAPSNWVSEPVSTHQISIVVVSLCSQRPADARILVLPCNN